MEQIGCKRNSTVSILTLTLNKESPLRIQIQKSCLSSNKDHSNAIRLALLQNHNKEKQRNYKKSKNLYFFLPQGTSRGINNNHKLVHNDSHWSQKRELVAPA